MQFAPIGQKLLITAINTTDSSLIDKFHAMGLFVGSEIVIIQKKPVYVISLHYSKFAIDSTLSELIDVRTV